MWQKWWYSWQLKQALKDNKTARADYYLQQLNAHSDRLPWYARLHQQNSHTSDQLAESQRKNVSLITRLQSSQATTLCHPDYGFIQQVTANFQLTECDPHLLRVTGIDREVFAAMESALADFISQEISLLQNKLTPSEGQAKLQAAIRDLLGLKQGIDPGYDLLFSPHIYLLRYFNENVYTNYLAWFLVYRSGLLPRELKLLDIAAGTGTVIYGLALLASSTRRFTTLPLNVAYYSLEQQAQLQYRGLQFWRSYIESLQSPLNAYARFNTLNLFDYANYKTKLPRQFFNFIAISHCFFYDSQQRQDSVAIYRDIFQHNLTSGGHVLLIIQGRKLYNLYSATPTEDLEEEANIMQLFLEDLGLQAEWYYYLSSTGKRTPMSQGFGKYARENLPQQTVISKLRQQYFGEPYLASYVVDDYVILAKKAE